jgi:hypothetical protein
MRPKLIIVSARLICIRGRSNDTFTVLNQQDVGREQMVTSRLKSTVCGLSNIE